MKFLESKFEDYIHKCENNLHKNKEELYDSFGKILPI